MPVEGKVKGDLIPEVAGVSSREAVDIQTEVGHGKIKDKEVTGIPHLLHREEGHDADGVQDEAEHSWKKKERRFHFIFYRVKPHLWDFTPHQVSYRNSFPINS